jgi:DNA-binding beta-propeller fold protein YncE
MGKKTEIILATEDSIKAVVPSKAGSGAVLLKVGEETIQGPSINYDYKVTVTTIAGDGSPGRNDGLNASFHCPWGIAANTTGDLFVADCYNRLKRKIAAVDYSVSSYSIPTWVNGENFYSPYNLALNPKTEDLYVTDFNEHLMKMDPSGNMDVIYIDTMPLTGIAVDPSGTYLYISNNKKGTIIRTDMNCQNAITFTKGLITPRNIIFNSEGQMFVAAYPGPIYEIVKNGIPSRKGLGSAFSGWEIAADSSGNFFLADHFNNCIKMIDMSGQSRVIAGSGEAADIDGIGLKAAFDGPQGITVDSKGNVYVTTYNYDRNTGNKVRKIVLE